MAVTREQLLNDPMSGARPMTTAETAERAGPQNAELAAQWLLATSPLGGRHQVQVSDEAVVDDMRRAGWHIHHPSRQAEFEPEAV
jgi:hypothetical protein